MIRAALFFGIALVSILPSLLVAAIGLHRQGTPFSVIAARNWIRAAPTRSVPLITLNVVIFAVLWWLVQRATAAIG